MLDSNLFFVACRARCVNKHTLERKAVKIITKKDMRDEEKDMLSAEIAIMKLVNHPNIIRMESVYESKKVRGGRMGDKIARGRLLSLLLLRSRGSQS